MKLTGGIFAIAAAASLLLHVLLFASFRVITIGPPEVVESTVAEMSVVLEPMPDVADPEPPVPPEPPPREWELGERGAKGYASHPLDGRREAIARQGNVDQAELSLDPSGRSLVVERPMELAEAAPPGGAPVNPLLRTLQLNLQKWAARLQKAREVAPDPAPEPLPVAADAMKPTSKAEAPVAATQEEVAAAPPPPTLHAQANPGALPVPSAAADPAPQSDSESDSFSTLGSAEFRDGRFTVRSGRKVKTRRPKIGLAGTMDVMQRRPVRVVLKVEVDAAGKVTKVDVAKSSGTNEIDQPCKVAMYEWWFEPRTDDTGRPVPDKFQFAIAFP